MRGKTVTKASEKMALPASEASHRTRTGDYLAIVVLAVAAFVMVCLLSYDPRDPSFNVVTHKAGVSNLGGLVGSHIADALVQVLGLAALFVPLAMLILATRLAAPSLFTQRWTAVCSALVLLSVLAVLMERLRLGPLLGVVPAHAGGAVGSFLHASCFKYFGRIGEIIVICTLMLVSVLHIMRISLKRCIRFSLWVSSRPLLFAMSAWWTAKTGFITWRRQKKAEALALQDSTLGAAESISLGDLTKGIWPAREPHGVPDEAPAAEVPWERVRLFPTAAKDVSTSEEVIQPPPAAGKRTSLRERITGKANKGGKNTTTSDSTAGPPSEAERGPEALESSLPVPDADSYEASLDDSMQGSTTVPEASTGDWEHDDDPRPASPEERPFRPVQVVDAEEGPAEGYHSSEALEDAIEEYLREQIPSEHGSPSPLVVTSSAPAAKTTSVSASEPPRPIRVTKRADEQLAVSSHTRHNLAAGGDYVLPPSDLLDKPPASNRAVDQKLLEENAAILEQKLADLGIRGEVVEIHPGPVITMYELILAAGIPLRKVLNTSDDLAMALKSGSTRVVAPIPGKDTVGIEVPNLHREIVYFREIIESSAFAEITAPLKVALGKGIDGTPFATSLVRMPHLLIAGATGTGKSVGLNCLICSWLMSCSPDDVKFLMVDPKRLELSYYQDIPHLIHPVVTEAEKVPKVLNWAIREMERRYELLSKTGAKNIASYNEKVAELRAAGNAEDPGPDKLPYIVIIVDELAELMMVAAKDIEISIARLAQMARASGIHLILATQRPSVDVITGVIKANFPARLSYQVSAKPDSRTILDTTGAEHLLGMGDMLFLPPGTAKLARLHGAYVSENDIRSIVDFIKAQRAPVYSKEIENVVAEADSTGAAADLLDDPKYDEALELVTRLGHASISLIQRHMRIGYNRAARIIEAMESEGIIGPSDGTSRPREVRAPSLDSIADSAPF
jgi:DNA segregation ATPase FtsK/SpoIIIE, S-DNA-T family